MLRRLPNGIARKSISGSTESGTLPSVTEIVAEDLSYATASSRAAYRQRTFLHLDREAVAATSTRALWIGFLR